MLFILVVEDTSIHVLPVLKIKDRVFKEFYIKDGVVLFNVVKDK